MPQKLPFRDHHTLALLEGYENDALPIDLAVHKYFRAHKALGSKDRATIAETVYELVRWRLLIDALIGEKVPIWKQRLDCWHRCDLASASRDTSLPPHIRCSCPESLFTLLAADYGTDDAEALARISNTPAPTTVRANRLKTTRQVLLNMWGDNAAAGDAPDAIIFKKRMAFGGLDAFKEGLFEVQDAASQCVASLVAAQPGDLVMDYCAGAGGKSLAIAPNMEGKGQLYLLDIRQQVLMEARKRLKRAGIQNGQTHLIGSSPLRHLKKKMDWVLVDAPCSGTGTLRRHPDMKWRFSHDALNKWVGKQRTIFEQALSFMKPGGRIVYATCSILKKENDAQIAHFCTTYNLEIAEPPFQTLPTIGGMDGFFGVVLRSAEKSHP